MLRRAGLISYHCGTLTIIDPQGLAEGACECYELMEAEFRKIFQVWNSRIEERSSVK